MKYLEIFDEVVSIMKTDYSGYEIKKDWGNEDYYRGILEEELKGDLKRERFTEIVQEYLLDFKDGHVGFFDNKRTRKTQYRGFSVRRYDDKLYIINAKEDIGLKKGMRIIKLDNLDINQAEKEYEKHLISKSHERQSWNDILYKFKNVTVEKEDGQTFIYELNEVKKEKTTEEKYTYQVIDDNTGMMKLVDFMDAVLMRKFLENNKNDIEKRENLIIDIRRNDGGLDDTFYILFDYLFPEGTEVNKILEEEYEMHTLITKRTFENRKAIISEHINDENRELYEKYFKFMEDNLGKGLVNTDIDINDGESKVVGSVYPKKVIVLTDVYCGSSGDQFALYCKKSSKVTIIGRNTRGIIDYSNVGFEKLKEDFQIMYPTSISQRVLFDKGYDNVGVPVDVYIPWTPEHVHEDIDLKEALNILRA